MEERDTKALCLVQDQSSHWYIIPLEKRSQWFAWMEMDEEDPLAWDIPDWAIHIEGPDQITFTDYEYK